MSRTPSKIAAPSPLAGAHSEDILMALNYTKDQIEILRKNGVI
jgi:crotonobetainyl-CoA:carnitine CoA-transferase CaiB-like acyl-CoA transferase